MKKKYDCEIKCSECGEVVELYLSSNKTKIIKGAKVICDSCWRTIKNQVKEINSRLSNLEDEVFADVCDNCGKKATYETGIVNNRTGKWCSKECEMLFPILELKE